MILSPRMLYPPPDYAVLVAQATSRPIYNILYRYIYGNAYQVYSLMITCDDGKSKMRFIYYCYTARTLLYMARSCVAWLHHTCLTIYSLSWKPFVLQDGGHPIYILLGTKKIIFRKHDIYHRGSYYINTHHERVTRPPPVLYYNNKKR